MKELEVKLEQENYSVVNLGKLSDLADYSISLPNGAEVKGKVFLGEAMKSTGVEISFQMMPPHTGIPFLHLHNKHEEVYIILSGEGKFQLDDEMVDICEGSVIRVAPEVKRCWENTSDVPMNLIVIQAKEGSLQNYYGSDGTIVS